MRARRRANQPPTTTRETSHETPIDAIGLVVHDMARSLAFYASSAPGDAVWGQRYAIVDDPDGNAVYLFSPTA